MAQLINNDCLAVLKDIPDNSVHMIFADLPYAVTHNRWDTPIDLTAFWRELLRLGTREAAFVFSATMPFASTLVQSQRRLFRYDLVWCKSRATGHMNARHRPLAAHELVLVFSRATCNPMSKTRMRYNAQMSQGTPYKSTTGKPGKTYGTGLHKLLPCQSVGTRHPTSLLAVAAEGRTAHPTQKPVALLEWLLRSYTNPGDTVLDPVMGSGTTGVACVNTNRNFIGIEKETNYFNVAKKRIENTQPIEQNNAKESI